MIQQPPLRAVRLLSISLLSSLVAACGGGASEATTTPVASPPPAASAPSPSSPASVASAGLVVPSWSSLSCDTTSGNLSSTEPSPVSSSGQIEQALFRKLNTARAAMCAGYLAPDTSNTLSAEASSRASATTNTKTSPVTLLSYDAFAVVTGYGGATFDAGIDALDGNGLEVVQLAQVAVSGGYAARSPQQRITTFAALQEADSRILVSALHDTPVAFAQRCVNELLSQPAQRQRLLDPRYRQLGAGSASLLSRNYAVQDQLTDTADAICLAVAASRDANYGAAGLATAPTGWVGIWPPQGSVVPFVDTHARGATNGTRHGYSASIAVDSQSVLTVQSFTIRDAHGNLVPTTVGLDALADATFQNWSFVTPVAPLSLNTQYTVQFQGAVDGMAINKTWTFSTPVALTAFDPRND